MAFGASGTSESTYFLIFADVEEKTQSFHLCLFNFVLRSISDELPIRVLSQYSSVTGLGRCKAEPEVTLCEFLDFVLSLENELFLFDDIFRLFCSGNILLFISHTTERVGREQSNKSVIMISGRYELQINLNPFIKF